MKVEPLINLDTPSTSAGQANGLAATPATDTAGTGAANTASVGAVDAGESPAAKRTKHTDVAEAGGGSVPAASPSAPPAHLPAPTSAAAGPSDAQGGSSLDTTPPNVFVTTLHCC